MGQAEPRIIKREAEIQAAIERIADSIMASTQDPRSLALVGIHTGGVFLARRLESILSRKLGLPIPVGTLDITLYRDDWTRLHVHPILKGTDLPFPIDDRDLVLVDDVLYTGRTIRSALDAIVDYGRPRRVQVAVLVDRDHRELPICGQFIGFPVDTSSEEQVNVLLVEKDGIDQIIIETPVPTETGLSA